MLRGEKKMGKEGAGTLALEKQELRFSSKGRSPHLFLPSSQSLRLDNSRKNVCSGC